MNREVRNHRHIHTQPKGPMMTATKTPKGAQPNPPHTFEVIRATAKTEVVHCADCGKTKHRRIRKDR